MQKKYSREEIKVISGQEAVRKRSSMYLGGDPSEPAIQNQMVQQCLCHALDEHINGICTNIAILLGVSEFQIEYDAGMSLEMISEDGICVAELIMTRLHACQNMKKNLEVGGKFCEIGIMVVNALSSQLEIETASKNHIGKQTYSKGFPLSHFEIKEYEGKEFTKLRVKPDLCLFHKINFDKVGLQKWVSQIRQAMPELIISINC
jgi:DNA gyrase subunit B